MEATYLPATKQVVPCFACQNVMEYSVRAGIETNGRGHTSYLGLCRSCTRELAFRMLEATGTVDACKLCGETVIEE